ncbi:MAG: hypothetical protein LBN00_06395 [Oscillospiraceae bacterium]|jgi:hypothetical protein|nr:hypothetical protein [Oscillospiraceae bacterium]
MNEYRFLVTAERYESAQKVTGFYVGDYINDGREYMITVEKRGARIKPETVQPFALTQSAILWSNSGCFCCQRINDYEIFNRGQKMNRPDYCPYCGQRLDWSKE